MATRTPRSGGKKWAARTPKGPQRVREEVELTPTSPNGGEQDQGIMDEIEGFAKAQRLSGANDLFDLDWKILRPVVEASAALSLGAKKFLAESCAVHDDHADESRIAELERKVNSLECGVGKKDHHTEDKNDTEKIETIRARLRFLGKSTSEVFDECLEQYSVDPYWPWKGTSREARISAEFLSNVFRGGQKAVTWAQGIISEKGLHGSFEADEMLLLCTVLDQLLLHDRLNVVNSSAVEVICRRLMGRVRSIASVTSKTDLAKKTVRGVVQYYDLVQFDLTTTGTSAADKEVKEEMKHHAEINKWMVKQQGSGVEE